MLRPDVRIGVKNQLPAVAMSLPLRNSFNVNASLNRARDEHSAQRTLIESRQSQPPTGIRQSMFRIGDLEDFVAADVPSTEPFDQWLQLREDRDHKAGRCCVPKCDIRLDLDRHRPA